MALLGASKDQAKVAMGWITEKFGRLKPNGELRERSPLSPLVELEGLSLGIEGKRSLWQALAAVDAVAGADRPRPARRADRARRGPARTGRDASPRGRAPGLHHELAVPRAAPAARSGARRGRAAPVQRPPQHAKAMAPPMQRQPEQDHAVGEHGAAASPRPARRRRSACRSGRRRCRRRRPAAAAARRAGRSGSPSATT